jgi:hypothetical protein
MNDDEIEQMLRGLVSEHLSGERQRHAGPAGTRSLLRDRL